MSAQLPRTTSIDEERDPLVIVSMLMSTARNMERFFTRPGADWGLDLADPGKRAALISEIELVIEIFDSLARLCERIGSSAMSADQTREARAQLNAWLRGEPLPDPVPSRLDSPGGLAL